MYGTLHRDLLHPWNMIALNFEQFEFNPLYLKRRFLVTSASLPYYYLLTHFEIMRYWIMVTGDLLSLVTNTEPMFLFRSMQTTS